MKKRERWRMVVAEEMSKDESRWWCVGVCCTVLLLLYTGERDCSAADGSAGGGDRGDD